MLKKCVGLKKLCKPLSLLLRNSSTLIHYAIVRILLQVSFCVCKLTSDILFDVDCNVFRY